MKSANGYGGITKLKGKRRKPYMAYVSEIKHEGILISPATQKSVESAIRALESASTLDDIVSAYARGVLELYKTENFEEIKSNFSEKLKKELKSRTFKAKQVKKPIGYFATGSEARIALAEYNKSPYDLDKRKVTFGEIYELAYKDARIEKKSDSTQKGYSASIKKCGKLLDMPIADIRHAHLQSVVDENSDKSRSSLRSLLSTYNLIYDYAMKNDLIDKNYAEFVKIEECKEKGDKTPFTREEVQFLWDNLDWKYDRKPTSPLYGQTISDVLLILIYSGVRINELLNTKVSDVHLDERYIDLMGTKTHAAKRLVPIHKKIAPLIEKRLSDGGEYLIVDAKKRKISYDNLNGRILVYFREQTGMKHNFHEARHTFATFTSASKLDPTMRSFIIGHSNNNITDDIYTHPEILLPELIAEIDKLEI